MSQSIRKSWNKIARQYQKTNRISTDDVHYAVFAPGERTLRLLGSVRRKTVIELGCGGGQNTVAVAKWGARATGLDISQEQIRFARRLAERQGVRARFLCRSMENLRAFPRSSADIVISAYAMSYVRNLARVFGQVHRILRPKGIFVFSDIHPVAHCVEARGREGRDWTVRRYFRRGKASWLWPRFPDGTTARFSSYHRTIEDYVELLNQAGFTLRRLLEPEPHWGGKTLSGHLGKTPFHSPVLSSQWRIWREVPYTVLFVAVRSGRAGGPEGI